MHFKILSTGTFEQGCHFPPFSIFVDREFTLSYITTTDVTICYILQIMKKKIVK